MPIPNYKTLAQNELDGKECSYSFRKAPTQATAAGIWFDLSMSSGNPTPNYYAASPTVSIALAQSTDGGFYHGIAPPNEKVFLKRLMMMPLSAGMANLPLILCDYLMYYPFMDMSIVDEQLTTNTITLPRYPTGEGVQMMAVEVAAQSGVGNPQFYVRYTNSDGVPNRITPLISCNTQTVNGTIITSSAATARSSAPFLPLQAGDRGVRSIEAIYNQSPDVGLISLVLVKKISDHNLVGIDAPVEKDNVVDYTKLNEIKPDAYLNFICLPSANIAGSSITGIAYYVWG
jgi:hypothetical protein